MSRNEHYRPRRPIPLFAHVGRPAGFLRRYLRDLNRALSESETALDELRKQLPEIISQPENLYSAWEHLQRFGGAAAGPDGVRAAEIAQSDVWGILRTCARALRDGTYQPAKPRFVSIPRYQRADRVIEVANLADRIVSRGAVQVLGPWLEPAFHSNSFGFRRRRGPLHALAQALQLASTEHRYYWVMSDLRDAFGSVPTSRLLDLVAQRFGTPVRSVVACLLGSRGRGLSQGAPLSPLLLNLYADKFIDWPWQRAFPDTPLLRYVDDLLILCRGANDAISNEQRLSQLLLPAGLQTKDDHTKSVVDVRTQPASWLGYEISRGMGTWEVDIRQTAWEDLRATLRCAQREPNAVRRSRQIIQGWLGFQGPSYALPKVGAVVQRLGETLERCGFEGIKRRQIRAWWRRGQITWKRILNEGAYKQRIPACD